MALLHWLQLLTGSYSDSESQSRNRFGARSPELDPEQHYHDSETLAVAVFLLHKCGV